MIGGMDTKTHKSPTRLSTSQSWRSRILAIATGVFLIGGLVGFGLTVVWVYLAFALRRTEDFLTLAVSVVVTLACLCVAKWVQSAATKTVNEDKSQLRPKHRYLVVAIYWMM